MIKTPAMAALDDEERFTQITNMSATVLSNLSHHVAKLLTVHLTIHPENMNPFTSNVSAVDHADEGQAFFCLGDQIKFPENGGAGSLLFAIVLPPRHRASEASSHRELVLNELNLGQNRVEENSLMFKATHPLRCA